VCRWCSGDWEIDGLAIHEPGCPGTEVLYLHHGLTLERWPDWSGCPWQCGGNRMTNVITHAWDCPWWDSDYNTGRKTPF